MKSNKRNEKYIQELNQIKADEKLKKNIMLNAENEKKKRGIVPLFSSVALVAASIILIIFVIRNGETNTGITAGGTTDIAISEKQPGKNPGTSDNVIATSENSTCGYNTEDKYIPDESTVEDYTTSANNGENYTPEDSTGETDTTEGSTGENYTPEDSTGENCTMGGSEFDIYLEVIVSGTYGQDDFKIEFVYVNETPYEMITGRSFWIEQEKGDGTNYTYEPEEDLMFEEDAWIIRPGQTRTENMTRYFTTGYPELTKEISNGKKVIVCDELFYGDGKNSGNITVKPIVEKRN